MQHIFTVDVEDWYNGFPPGYLRASKDASRLDIGMNFLLDALDETGAKATLFWIGRHAITHPSLLRETMARGHEIGVHGYEHRPLYLQNPKEFEEDTAKAIVVISEITGKRIQCYRAPYFSIRKDTLWAFEILASLGITHDSSILPMRHWRTGMPAANPRIHHIHTPSGTIVEVPIRTRKLLGLTIPVSGGGYFRVYPYEFTKSNIAACQAQRIPAVFYIHPWEMDPDHPRIARNGLLELMHYAGLRTARRKLAGLLQDHSFGPLIKGADEFLRFLELDEKNHKLVIRETISQ